MSEGKLLKTGAILLFLFAVHDIYSQDFSDIIQYKDSNAIERTFYNFKRNTISSLEKRELVESILKASSEDISLLHYLGIDPDNTNIDQFLTATNPHIEEFLSNIHFLDIDSDLDLDVIYQMKMPHYETHRIRIFANLKSRFKSIEVPGHFITDMTFSNGMLKQVKTTEIGCCDFPFDIYRKIIIDDLANGSLKIIYCTAIPKRMEIEDPPISNKIFVVKTDSVQLRISTDHWYNEYKIFLSKNQKGKILSEESNHGFIVNVENNTLLNGIKLTHVWGWLYKSEIEIIK